MSPEQHLEPVLVVDDEQDIREGVERILSRQGCQVSQAADGRQCLEMLDKQLVSLVLLDLKMPGMDGLEVLGHIKQSWPEMMVIVITGFATVEMAIEAMKLGAYDFIPKPFKPDHLRLTVGRALERKRLSDQARRLELERQKTLADLDNEKSRTRTVIRALPFGVVVTTLDGKVALLNPAFLHMVGLASETRPGGDLRDYVDDPGLEQMVGKITRGEQGDDLQGWSYEFSTRHQKYLLARGTQILSDEGESLGAVLVLVDLTAFKMLEQLKNEFVAKVSHELRSPLSTIHLQLSVLLGDGMPDGGEQQRHLLARAKQRTEGLIGVVRDLLDMSRLESGMDGQTLQEVGLEPVLDRVMETISPQAQDRSQSLKLETPDERLPPLMADPMALESLFANLVGNAVKYTPQGGSIMVKADQDGPNLRVMVSDTGLGISPEHQARVFEKFYRVKSEQTRSITGTGLGLPIVKSVVDQLGGSITLESQPGKGSTFTVLLPLAPAAAQGVPQPQKPAPGAS